MKNFGINDKSYNLLTNFFKQHYEVEIVKVWGSRMDGTFHSSSDIDLFIKFINIGNRNINVKELEKDINLLPIPYRIQLSNVDSNDFNTLMKYFYNFAPIFYEKE